MSKKLVYQNLLKSTMEELSAKIVSEKMEHKKVIESIQKMKVDLGQLRDNHPYRCTEDDDDICNDFDLAMDGLEDLVNKIEEKGVKNV